MPFCPNCGKEADPGAIFCANCGRPLQGTSQPPPYVQPAYYSRKEEAVAAILSLIIPGVGQMYVGRIVRGIIIFLIPPIFFIFVFLPIFLGGILTRVVPIPTPPGPGVQPPSFLVAFAFFPLLGILLWLGFLIWNVFDAYNLAKIYNYQLTTTGRPPW